MVESMEHGHAIKIKHKHALKTGQELAVKAQTKSTKSFAQIHEKDKNDRIDSDMIQLTDDRVLKTVPVYAGSNSHLDYIQTAAQSMA